MSTELNDDQVKASLGNSYELALKLAKANIECKSNGATVTLDRAAKIMMEKQTDRTTLGIYRIALRELKTGVKNT